MQAVLFLIDTAFSLYLMVVILRLWLQLVRADFYNPFSQFVVKATNPLVLPLRRIIPSLGRLDTATLLLAYAIMLAKLVILQLIQSGQVLLVPSLILSLIFLLKEIFTLLFWILVIRALLSWFSQGRSPVENVMLQLTEPLLRPIRRILPPLGGLDLSVLVVLIGLQFLNILFSSWFPGL
ncbi:YggT family protein [Rheinheimera sp. YQF-2]|jgi:YggT family protein|uniref:YggT family protein n=1 Tax=Rheinheimera lutimaris TaxID=2740584 RepID=A0A7Y5AMX3_9GAMM|nr:YggT family protein [Rheinheimera lutimaris]NRQ41288.1 YggT family protein [Rheinheimera lutimaris]